MVLPERATQPTMYFIGVTTGKSSIMRIFPGWAKALGRPDIVLKGIDIEIHAEPEVYRKAVQFIKDDPLCVGALVTTHKIDIYNACSDMFEYLDPYALRFGEMSSISKKDGRLEGYAKDPISSALALDAFIPENFFAEHGGELFIMGAGGSAICMCNHLLDPKRGANVPSRLVVANRSQPRLTEIEHINKQINPDANTEYVLSPTPDISDGVMKTLKPYSLIINATGLGKDRPGSPITDEAQFPENSLVWEINYRGALDFMHQAERQKEEKDLYIEDGWIYFIHGWTQVVAEVFHIELTKEAFDACERIAYENR